MSKILSKLFFNDLFFVYSLLEIAKSKINFLLKILKNFVDRNRQNVNIKKETAKLKEEKAQPTETGMLVDEDELEYTKKGKNLESVQTKRETNAKKKGIPLYEIK
jgi:hypothetical protein